MKCKTPKLHMFNHELVLPLHIIQRPASILLPDILDKNLEKKKKSENQTGERTSEERLSLYISHTIGDLYL